MSQDQEKLTRQSDELYARYVAPLDPERRGEYVAVSPDGRMVLAASLGAVSEAALAQLGHGSFVFKVDHAVRKWR